MRVQSDGGISIDLALALAIVMRENQWEASTAAQWVQQMATDSGHGVEQVAREIVRNGTAQPAEERARALVASGNHLTGVEALLVVEQAILIQMRASAVEPDEAAATLLRASAAGGWDGVVAAAAVTVAAASDTADRNGRPVAPNLAQELALGPVEVGRAITVVMAAEDCGIDDASRLIRDIADDAHPP